MFNKFKKLIINFFTPRLMGFYSGGTISYFAGNIFAGKATYQQGILPSVIFGFGDWQVHLHHWLMSFLVLLLFLIPLFSKKKINAALFLFSFGFCLGLMAQGVLSYSDWYEVFTKID